METEVVAAAIAALGAVIVALVGLYKPTRARDRLEKDIALWQKFQPGSRERQLIETYIQASVSRTYKDGDNIYFLSLIAAGVLSWMVATVVIYNIVVDGLSFWRTILVIYLILLGLGSFGGASGARGT